MPPSPEAEAGVGRVPGHTPVQDTLMRALAWLRVIVLLNAFGVYAWHVGDYTHPVTGWVALGVLTVWTAVVVASAQATWRCSWVLLGADLAVAVAAIVVSPYVKGPGWNATVPGFWVMGVVLSWAVLKHWRGGLAAALVVSAADLSIRAGVTQKAYGNIFLLIVGGLVVGYLSELLQRTAAERDRAERAAAAAAERQRLARVVHDGVLQVLALVQRHAPDLGGEGVELGRLAGEQEARLRAFVQQGPTASAALLGGGGPAADAGSGPVDLARLLGELATSHVQVSLPGGAVPAPGPVARELTAAVEACLSNVRHHVGRDAPAWVLLEDLPDRWVVSVRDRGPGIPAGRLEDAAGQGRLGVRQSIRGRLDDLGGTAVVRSEPGEGTSWELSVPRPARGR